MGKIAFVFSGQGAQYPGMGKDFYQNNAAVKDFFDAAEALRPGTLKMMFEGTSKELSQTKNTQPSVYLVDMAAAIVMREQGVQPQAVAGFSLGEVAAAAFGGYFSALDGFSLVLKRANLMENALEHAQTGMAAVLKLSNLTVETLCRQIENLYPVNYNCPGQLVVAGKKSALTALKSAVEAEKGRLVPLAVSGAFHSPYMRQAAGEFARELQDFPFSEGEIPVYSNTTARPYENPKEQLARQIESPVLWENTIRNMAADGFDTFIEVGPGKTLCGLIVKTCPQATVYHVEDSESAVETAKAVL